MASKRCKQADHMVNVVLRLVCVGYRALQWPPRPSHPQARAVNPILGKLKTALSGTYKAFSFKKYGIAIWPRSSTASIRDSICAHCSAAWPLPPCSAAIVRSAPFELLRLVTNQGSVSGCFSTVHRMHCGARTKNRVFGETATNFCNKW